METFSEAELFQGNNLSKISSWIEAQIRKPQEWEVQYYCHYIMFYLVLAAYS